jgi:hypothetical protein
MSRRVAGVTAVVAAAVLLAGVPASAQTYPPPQRSITVSNSTPSPGQSIDVALRTCRPGTVALIGIGLSLVGAPTVGSDGVARATVTVPRHLRPGRHTVSGACLTPDGSPLFLTTRIRVVAPSGGGGAGGGSGGGGGAVSPAPGGSGTGGAAAGPIAGGPAAGIPAGAGAAGAAGPAGMANGTGYGTGTGSGGSTGVGSPGTRTAAPSLAGLEGSTAPDDAADLFEAAAEANGVTDGDPSGEATARNASTAGDGGGSQRSTMSTIARVALGIAALGGVPVALAVSRRQPRHVRRRFA